MSVDFKCLYKIVIFFKLAFSFFEFRVRKRRALQNWTSTYVKGKRARDRHFRVLSKSVSKAEIWPSEFTIVVIVN